MLYLAAWLLASVVFAPLLGAFLRFGTTGKA